MIIKRKRLGLTNYKKRLNLLKSGKDRLVIRLSNKNIIAQVVKYSDKGDKVLAFANSRELIKLGWTGARRNTPVGYLVGLLLSKKSKIKDVVCDFGFHSTRKGTIVYAVVKGAIDGGMKIPCDESVFPDDKRIKGEHIKIKDFEKVKKNIGAMK